MPAAGLSPKVNIRDLSTHALVVSAGAMTEIGDGFYSYDFSGYNAAKDYAVLCDGGAALSPGERYASAATTVEGEVTGIKAKTDVMGGPGGIPWSYTLTNSVTSLPIPDARVWITTDLAGKNVIASGYTNNFGVVSFTLEAGPINIWREKAGFNFDNPTQEVVA